jgi:hypothetical protein
MSRTAGSGSEMEAGVGEEESYDNVSLEKEIKINRDYF